MTNDIEIIENEEEEVVSSFDTAVGELLEGQAKIERQENPPLADEIANASFDEHLAKLTSDQAEIEKEENVPLADKIANASFDEHVEALNADESDSPKASSRDSSGAKWYVLHTYSGYESMVQENLHLVFAKNNMSDRLFETLVPMEDVVEEKNGKRKVVKRRKFPCYVIVKMIYYENMWHMITNTRGVTGFVGPGGRPIALTSDEVKRMNLEQVIIETDISVGDKVKVLQGPLADFIGDVESVDAINSKLKVVVSMFGRDTPVDLEMYQVERII